MNSRKNSFILFYTLVLLMVISILLVTIHNSSLGQQRYIFKFYDTEQELLIKYCIKKASIPTDSNIQLKNSFGKVFNINELH